MIYYISNIPYCKYIHKSGEKNYYLTKKEFEKVKNDKTKIVGALDLRRAKPTKYTNKKDNNYLYINRDYYELKPLEPLINKRIKGYFNINDNKYIAYTKSGYLLFILLMILALIVGLTIAGLLRPDKYIPETTKPTSPVMPSNEEDITKTHNSENEVSIPVYPTIWNVSKESTMKLSNPSENTVLLEYTLSDENGEVFYISPKIKPGEEIKANIGNKLKAGSHNCLMTIKSYDSDNSPASSATGNSSITIRIK